MKHATGLSALDLILGAVFLSLMWYAGWLVAGWQWGAMP